GAGPAEDDDILVIIPGTLGVAEQADVWQLQDLPGDPVGTDECGAIAGLLVAQSSRLASILGKAVADRSVSEQDPLEAIIRDDLVLVILDLDRTPTFQRDDRQAAVAEAAVNQPESLTRMSLRQVRQQRADED